MSRILPASSPKIPFHARQRAEEMAKPKSIKYCIYARKSSESEERQSLSAQEVHLPVEGVHPGAMDKRSRLSLVSPYVESGLVVFPHEGCEQLIAQLTGFGFEKFDDLVDAFCIAVTKTVELRLKESASQLDHELMQAAKNDPHNKPIMAGIRKKKW